MNVFEAVKQSVTTRQAAEMYGVNVRRGGMACCIFHEDKTPSMKVDRRFHCFGCQEDGDVIDFTAQLFGIGVKPAAEKLAADFGIYFDSKSHSPPRSIKRKLTEEQQLRKETNHCYRALCDYLHLMEQWQAIYAPEPEDEEWYPLFIEALQKTEYVKYLLDILLEGTMEEKKQLVHEKRKDVMEIEKRIKKYTEQYEHKRQRRLSDLGR